MPARNKIEDTEWERQARLFELGCKHATEIAADLGVSPQTVSREMKRRGVRKGALVGKSVESLNRYLDRKAAHRKHMELTEAQRRTKAQESTTALLAAMMQSLVLAEQAGDLSLVFPVIEETAAIMGVRLPKNGARA